MFTTETKISLQESTQNFLTAVLNELTHEDAAAMFQFLTAMIQGSPKKLNRIAQQFKDPKTQEQFKAVMESKNELSKMTKGAALVKKIFG